MYFLFCSYLAAGSRLSYTIVTLPLWEKGKSQIFDIEKFNLDLFSESLEEIILKYTLDNSSSHKSKPCLHYEVHKSPLQMLLDENSLQAMKPNNEPKPKSSVQNIVTNTRQNKHFFFNLFGWRKQSKITKVPFIATKCSLDIDWLDFAYKSSVDIESLSNDACYVFDVLNDIINRIRTTESTHRITLRSGKIAILDFSNSSLDDLRFLMQLFTGCSMDEAKQYSFSDMLQNLSVYIPFASIQQSKSLDRNAQVCFSCGSWCWFSKFYFCQYCGKAFCSSCILRRHIYQLNSSCIHFICKHCFKSLDNQDAELWKEKCLTLIVADDLKSILAAHGCMAMAICNSDIDANNLLYSVAKKLSEQSFFAVSLEFFTNYLYNCTDTESVKAYVAVGSTLQKLATLPNMKYLDKVSVLMAASSAYACAQKAEDPIEIPSLERNIRDVTINLNNAHEAEKEVRAKEIALKLETAWTNRNCSDMISVLLETEEGYDSHFFDNNYAMVGLEKFLLTKVEFNNTMHSDDSAAIMFFQSILKLHKKDYDTGLCSLEKAFWKGWFLPWMNKAVIDILISLLSCSCYSTPHENLPSLLQKISVSDLFSNKSNFLTFLNLSFANLDVPFTRYWPHICVVEVNYYATYKYEHAALQHFKRGKWKGKDVALAYIDYIPSCEHHAEICACFLLAGLWFLKDLKSMVCVNISDDCSQTNFNLEVHATKQAAVLCTGLAFCASQQYFYLGIHLYFSQVCLQIILDIKKCVQPLFSKQDGYLLLQLLKGVIHTCRFFPFWHIPIVMACEAPLLYKFMVDLSSEFVLSLQHIPHEKLMLFKDYELKYQLYENNLLQLCPLDNPDEAKLQAMNSMLIEHGWSLEDVSLLMTSPLSPRTPEGWLIQQSKLGIPMEYASIEGFVLDLKKPSLKLLVVIADKENIGLVSQDDLRECLWLPNSSLYFSLDPPDDDHRYHPF